MCIVPKRESPTPPPPPTDADRPPAAPRSTDANVRRARDSARRVAARASGRQSTLLGGALTSTPANQPTKTLLGQ